MKQDIFLKWALVISVMLLIFTFSSQPSVSSSQLSDHFITIYEKVVPKLTFLPSAMRKELCSRPGHYVRKLAHVMIYAALGAVTLLAIWQVTARRGLCPIIALLVCNTYALTDECHQYYVAGRGAQLSDVVIDSMGALMGIVTIEILSIIIKWMFKREKGNY